MLVIIKSLVVAQKYKHISELAIINPLTGVYNRNFIYPELNHQIKIAERYGHPFSVVLIDLDNFKVYNDTHGHIDGDSLLHSITRNIKKNLRKSDLIGRFGGDEFIILPNTGGEEAVRMMERLKIKLDSEVLFMNDIVSLSYGTAIYPKDGKSIDDLLINADKALYKAKDLRKSGER